MPEFALVIGADLCPYVPSLARLRIQVFREYPYLYDGTDASEAEYLTTYIQSPRAVAVLAFDNDRMIGASTGLPMSDEVDAFRKPFTDKGMDTDSLFYGGETVLLPEYRGGGLYKSFLFAREDYARSLGSQRICFCGVVRDTNDPRQPNNYRPLDQVWRHFGYQPQTDLIAHFPWKEVGGTEEISHPLMFWMKELD